MVWDMYPHLRFSLGISFSTEENVVALVIAKIVTVESAIDHAIV